MKLFRAAILIGALIVSAVIPTASSAVSGTWNFVPSPSPATGTGALYAVDATTSSDAWAVGTQFTTAEANGIVYDATKTLTMHWNGSTWNMVTSPNPSSIPEQNILAAVAALAPDDVWAVGSHNNITGTGSPVAQTLTLHWNGTAWSVVPSPLIVIASLSGGSSFSAVSAIASDNVWAVGVKAMSSPDPDEAPLAARWNGSSWVQFDAPPVGNKINQFQGVFARTANDVWAVGTWRSLVTTFHVLIEHWNGTTWTLSPAPDPGNNDQLLAVAALSASEAWAVGERNDPITGSQPLIMRWNGSGWSVQSLPEFPGDFNRLNAVRAISSNDVWAAGTATIPSGGPTKALIMHWNGVSWTTVAAGATPGASEYFSGLGVVGSGDVWAVGSYQNPTMIPLVERFHATASTATPSVPGYALEQNSPNPFNPSTAIRYVLPSRERVVLTVYDASGRVVRTLVDGVRGRGAHSVSWDGRDDAGAAVASGVYLYRLRTGTFSSSRKMVLLK